MRALIVLLALACAAPSLAEDERFSSDKPTPLKRLKPAKEDDSAEPVTELTFINREQAGRMLLELPTVQKALEREQDQLGSEGAATVAIRDYQAVVECDHRYYVAQLVSVKRP